MASFTCPKCGGVGEAAPDAQGVVTCPRCGARLRSRPATPAPGAPIPTVAPAITGPGLDMLLDEIRAVRAVQEEMLALLRAKFPAGDDEDDDERPRTSVEPHVRSRRRKSVLLIDDDPATRGAAKTALEAADVPVRVVDDGNAALAAIAEDKPDVIALELDMGGSMAGKDVINMIKATMEWVDIPIVLYTRAGITSQREARTTHGADEYVLKGAEGPAALVTRVITLFRRT